MEMITPCFMHPAPTSGKGLSNAVLPSSKEYLQRQGLLFFDSWGDGKEYCVIDHSVTQRHH
jgi:hypothetical protein